DVHPHEDGGEAFPDVAQPAQAAISRVRRALQRRAATIMYARYTNSSAVRGQPTQRSQKKPFAVRGHRVRPPTATTRTRAMGRRTFQATYMSWSTRRRGSVHRSHIMTKTRN